MIAAAHPGKMGDTLYTLPLLRYLYGVNGEKIDFYTSFYCEPLEKLFRYQPYINDFFISHEYRLERMDMGCQPADVPIHKPYPRVYQLGFKHLPDCALHQFIAKEQGVTQGLGIRYEYPEVPPLIDRPFIIIAPRGHSSFEPLLNEFAGAVIDHGIDILQIGGYQEGILQHGYNICGYDMLDTLAQFPYAKAFVGLMSSQLVLANGFDIPRIALGGQNSDMRHAVQTSWNHYPTNPTVAELLHLTGII